MPMLSLQDLCKRQAIRMINQIDDLGDMSFRLAKPLLLKVQTAVQLYHIEQNSPHFIGETRDLWLDLIKRDVPNWQTKPHEPKNPESWYKVYKKLVKESDQEIEEDAAILQATLKGLEEQRSERTSKVVDPRTTKLPRLAHATSVSAFKHRISEKDKTQKTSDLRFTSGSKTKMVTGKDVIQRARREARERTQIIGKNAVLARPTHTLQKKATRIYDAPLGLIDEQKRYSASSTASGNHTTQVKVIAPRKSSADPAFSSTDPGVPHKYTREEREARLRAISSGKPLPLSSPSSNAAAQKPLPKAQLTTKSASPNRISGLVSTTSSRPTSITHTVSPPKKRKREGSPSSKSKDVDALFSDSDTEQHPTLTATESVFSDADKAAKIRKSNAKERLPSAPAASSSPPPPKRRKSNSPPQTFTADERPRAIVRKAPVDIFMRKGPRIR